MEALDSYLKQYSTPQSEALDYIEKQTHLKTNHARMLSGPVQGRLIAIISRIINPLHILELGTFTGYSTVCLSEGLREGGSIDALEINDELEDLIRDGYAKAGISDRVNLMFGDAKALIPTLSAQYDLVYIDANKREYVDYYQLVIEKVVHGGIILADNVLWDGKVLEDPPQTDAQTQGILSFNKLVSEDERVENVIIPLRDGLNLIRVK